MKISINLASQPFRRDRAILVASTAVCVILLLTLGGLAYLYTQDRAQGAAVQLEINQLNGHIDRAKKQQADLDAVLRRPENALVLQTSGFINELIYRKAISWSQLFNDLEATIPYNVRLTALVPSLNPDNKVTLDITVAADKGESLIQFAMALEQSSAFRNVQPHTVQPPSQSEPFYTTRVTVSYDQKL
jgi:Tfp pilus assembly protein PilN